MKTSRLPPLGTLRAFDAVANCLSFKRAAAELSVSATAVSHQIRLLESVLECRVFERSAQEVRLTEAGQLLYAATQNAFSSLGDAVKKIDRLTQSPALIVTTTSNFLTNWLLPRLADFKARCPQIDVHLHTSVEPVDLKQRTVDVAIRYRESAEHDLHSTLLCEDRFIVVASPALNLHKPADLNRTTLLHVDNRHTPQESPDWQHWKQRYGPEGLNLSRGLHFSDETHALQAAVAGHGAVIASELLVGDLINRGMLVAPYAGSLPGANYYLVALVEMAFRAEVVALREWIQSRVQL